MIILKNKNRSIAKKIEMFFHTYEQFYYRNLFTESPIRIESLLLHDLQHLGIVIRKIANHVEV